MKTDLTTSIIAAIIGTVIAYFVCGIFLPSIESVEFNILDPDADLTYSLTEPNAEIFNYRSVNPTVEVYVGQCENGSCDNNIIIDTNPSPVEPEAEPETEPETEPEDEATDTEESETEPETEPSNGTTD